MAKSIRKTSKTAVGEKPSSPAIPGGAPKNESAAFKRMKQGLSQPAGLANLPGGFGGGKKSGAAFKNQKQVGRNQTPDGGPSRTGVPRRTGGG